MTETQKRIKEYKKQLPHMKERVMAVLLLFAISVAMLTSVSFAWMTLSRSPEVSSIFTTVTTNGNLEIALSGPDGLQPNATAVGDGGRDVTLTNLAWGNLINLSSESYGLSKITLRPASLDINNLATSPINAVYYGEDGRVESTMTDFAYSSFDIGTKEFKVSAGMRYGVRGISSVTYKQAGVDYFFDTQLTTIYKKYVAAGNAFSELYNNEGYMKAVYRLVQEYANIQMKNDPTDIGGEMATLVEMTDKLIDVVEMIGETYAEMANLMYATTLEHVEDYEAQYTLEHVLNNSIPSAHTKNFKNYSKFRSLYNNLQTVRNGFEEARGKAEAEDVFWDDISTYANLLCDMTKATVNGMTIAQLKAAIKPGDSMLDIDMNFVNEVKTWDVVPAVIHKGLLLDVDHFLGCDFYVPSKDDLSVTVSVAGLASVTMHPYVHTSVYNTGDSYTLADYRIAENALSEDLNFVKEAVAAEIYAMAIDLWVRTNLDDALLILEGDVITETRPLKDLDRDGNEVDSYTYTYTKNGKEETLLVYKVVENGTDKWYVTKTHQPLTDAVADAVITADNPKLNTEEVTVGYGGVNRVWSDVGGENSSVMLPAGTTSLTQGSGSCYIFYPESAEDQEQIKKLLSAMRIAFIDEDYKLLARAYLDAENPIEDSGRVIVPLRLFANPTITVAGENEEYYVTRLERNEAKRITALMYLDGSTLENGDVMAAGSITGQLNIQFGTSSMDMDPMENKDLMSSYYSVSKQSPVCSADAPYTFENGQEWMVKVSMEIAGTNPSKVVGNFLSVINATQGARQDEFELILNPATGYYEALVSFKAAGYYQLRSIQIDGVDFPLGEEDIVHVKVPGMNVSTLEWEAGNAALVKTHLTANSSYTQVMNLQLGSEDGKVHNVQGVFLGDNGKSVTVNFKHAGGINYTGEANFKNTGVYKMTYLYIDGTLTALNASKYKTLDVRLGLRAEVRLSAPIFDDSVSQEEQDQILSRLEFKPGIGYTFVYNGARPVYFDVTCIIRDDNNRPVEGLEGMTLYYGQGTTVSALSTPLHWNGREYVERLDFSGYGVYNFSFVHLENMGYITEASMAHGITSIPAEPMEYVGISVPENGLFVNIGGQRTISVSLKNASAAKMKLQVMGEDGVVRTLTKYTTSQDDRTGITTFNFVLNDDSMARDTAVFTDGVWTVTGVQVGTVFYDGIFYAGEDENEDSWLNLIEMIRETNANLTAKFITEIQMNLEISGTNADGIFDLGNKAIGSQFTMPSAALKITFTGYDGQNIVEYGIPMNVSVNGTYSWTYNTVKTTSGTPDTVAITGNVSVLNAQNSVLLLQVAPFTVDGVWKLDQLKVTLNGKEYTVNSLPNVKVTWDKPTVTVTGTDPKPGTQKRVYTVKTPNSSSQAMTGDFFKYSNYKATVYIHTPTSGGSLDQEAAEAYAPSVSLKLTGVPTSASASMLFTSPNADSVNSTFTFSGGTATTTVGKAVNGERGWFGVDKYPECYPAGLMKQNKISVTYGAVTYEVELTHEVIIDQPLSPTALVFAGVPESYNGSVTIPGQTLGDGSMVTVTLPAVMEWTATVEKPKDGTWSAYTSVGEVAEVNGTKTKALSYTTWTVSGTCSDTTYYTYQYFVWTKFQSSITAETDIYEQDYQITQWLINGKYYNAGETVTVEGQGLLSATARVVKVGAERYVKTTEQTSYKYLYGYVAQDKVTKSETKPDTTCIIIGTVGDKENSALSTPKLADISGANAATGATGTNLTTDVSGYAKYAVKA